MVALTSRLTKHVSIYKKFPKMIYYVIYGSVFMPVRFYLNNDKAVGD